jgi:hypothetical protein
LKIYCPGGEGEEKERERRKGVEE